MYQNNEVTQFLILSWEYPPYVVGGLGQHVAELAPALAERGLDIHVITPVEGIETSSQTVENGVTVHRVNVSNGDMPTDIHDKAVKANEAVVEYAKQTWPMGTDLIHAHDWLMSFSAVALQELWECPLITTIHATERGRVRGYVTNHLQKSIEKAELDLIEQSSQIIVCSHHMYDEVQSFFRTPPEKLTIVPNGVNGDDLHNDIQTDLTVLRAKYAAPDEPIVFSVGRLVYEKGIHLIVQAAPRIIAEQPTCRFIIAGKGPEAENLKQQADILGVADHFDFIGFVSNEERNGLFKVANCAVFPSLYEPFGIVALEAMALGCPVVVSDIGGLAEIVEHDKTGITIYANDDQSVAWGILHALQNSDQTQAYADKAAQAVTELFNWQRIARLTEEMYNKVHQSMQPLSNV